jgi:hypothetical protein
VSRNIPNVCDPFQLVTTACKLDTGMSRMSGASCVWRARAARACGVCTHTHTRHRARVCVSVHICAEHRHSVHVCVCVFVSVCVCVCVSLCVCVVGSNAFKPHTAAVGCKPMPRRCCCCPDVPQRRLHKYQQHVCRGQQGAQLRRQGAHAAAAHDQAQRTGGRARDTNGHASVPAAAAATRFCGLRSTWASKR